VGVIGSGVAVGLRVIVAVAVGVGVSVGALVGVVVGVDDGGSSTASRPSADSVGVGERSTSLRFARLPACGIGAKPRLTASVNITNTAAMPMANQTCLEMGVCSTPLRRLRR